MALDKEAIWHPAHVHSFTAGGTIVEGAMLIMGAADHTVLAATVADPTEAVIGAALHAAVAGDSIDVAVGGIKRMIANAAITRGKSVTAAGTSDGKIKTAAPAAGARVMCVGQALSTAAAQGDVISVMIGIHVQVTPA